ncbi:hypothetical protein TRIHO_29730 [Tritonibacter horizontis]|uniref:4Fe-4S ferredoxin-type domain-containing protein n=2 Tax=Tritonibacter horizontis TaxID=1768241 RepID=A0A132BUT2_9RHOB|nr:hypothetical protein TRIHO_29730 [Tritonibacter horizontis]
MRLAGPMSEPSPSAPPALRAAPYDDLAKALTPLGLMIYGALHPARVSVPEATKGTLILIGTAGSFWSVLRAAPEGRDGQPDPVDRWSERGIGTLARHFGATPRYPFGGPPHAPFIAWALASGRAFTSPSQMLVHDEVGLMISYRGALLFDEVFDFPVPPLAQSPCQSCAARPCLSACPVHALVDAGPYKLAACHDHLATQSGAVCMASGCLARRACPLSSGSGRQAAQSAHHMRYFHRQ